MILRDPVHGIVSFESEEASIVETLLDTREVQRLRRIRQLGLTSLAFPGAEHTRFAHAIGAAHVMQLFLTRLRQIDHELPFWQRVTSDRAREAIVAAFLHDLGHGPFSHLFEQALPQSFHHEAWTANVILDSATEVHRVLAARDPHLPQRVVDLICGRHELPYLSKAVSGTFDVDRCDYLLRDAHATGVRYGQYDLPWLLRSFRFSEGSDAPGLAIDGTKGLSAIESFLLARLFMFQQVYFHKSTRAAEWMVRTILRRVVSLLQTGERLAQIPEAITSAAHDHAPSLGSYLEMDDQVLLSSMHEWEQARDPILRDLCQRLRRRNLFKTFELYSEPDENRSEHLIKPTHEVALGRAREIAKQAQLDPDIYVGLDFAVDIPYAEDESLSVIFPNDRKRFPAEVSFLLERLRNQPLTRVRLIFAAELEEAMRKELASP